MMSAIASYCSYLKGVIGMAYAGWLPFTNLYVEPVDLHGRTALVTGANISIGYECALKLAHFGANVWLLCRDPVKAEAARVKLVEATGIEATGNQQIKVAIVDFNSFDSVRHFVEHWDKRPIDIIINNAGTASGRYLRTNDGHELTHQTNILSQILFTLGLLPYLAEHARIVNVASHTNYSVTQEYLDAHDLESYALLEGKLGLHEGDELLPSLSTALYAKSKALQIIFGRQLQQRLATSSVYWNKNIVIHSCHPGMVTSTIWGRPTTFSSSAARLQAFVERMVFTFGTSCEQGACTPVFLATAPQAAIRGGGYWDRMSERTPGVLMLDDALGDALWDAWMAVIPAKGLSKGLQKRKAG